MRVSFNPGRDRHSRLRFRLAHLPDNWVWLGDGNRRVGLAEKKKKKKTLEQDTGHSWESHMDPS